MNRAAFFVHVSVFRPSEISKHVKIRLIMCPYCLLHEQSYGLVRPNSHDVNSLSANTLEGHNTASNVLALFAFHTLTDVSRIDPHAPCNLDLQLAAGVLLIRATNRLPYDCHRTPCTQPGQSRPDVQTRPSTATVTTTVGALKHHWNKLDTRC